MRNTSALHCSFGSYCAMKRGSFTANTTKTKCILKVSLPKYITALKVYNQRFISSFWEARSENYMNAIHSKHTIREIQLTFFPVFPLLFWVTKHSGEVCYCSLQFKCIHFLITVSNWLCSVPIQSLTRKQFQSLWLVKPI